MNDSDFYTATRRHGQSALPATGSPAPAAPRAALALLTLRVGR